MDCSSPYSRPDESSAVPAGAPTDGAPSWVGHQVSGIRTPLDISGTATAVTAAWARRQFAAWLAVDLAAGERFDDLVLVVYEALANTVDHAYRGTDVEVGPVRLLACRITAAIQVTVSDHGTWHDAPGAEAFRGRGLSLIRSLVRDVHVELGPTGTIVHLRTPLPHLTAQPSNDA